MFESCDKTRKVATVFDLEKFNLNTSILLTGTVKKLMILKHIHLKSRMPILRTLHRDNPIYKLKTTDSQL